MIQRIQTLYLFIGAIAAGLTFAFPLANFMNELNLFDLYIYGIDDSTKMGGIEINIGLISGLIAIGAIIPLLSFISIFLFKNRKTQANLVRIVFFINIVLIIFLFLFVDFVKKNTNADVSYQLAIIFPLISMILFLLARRSIIKDEKLIRSANRLR